MIKCKICGNELPDGTKTCPECSFRLAPDAKDERYCPSCFVQLSQEDESCAKCGFTLPAVVHKTEDTAQYINKIAAEYSEKNIVPPLKAKYFETTTEKYKKELAQKDEQLKSLQKEINELNYEFLVQKSKNNETTAGLETLRSELRDRERMIETLLEEMNMLQNELNDALNNSTSLEEIRSLQSEISSLNTRTSKAERDRTSAVIQLSYTEGYAHVMENIVFCVLLCINQIWATEYPEIKWLAYLSIGISVLVFIFSTHNIARCYSSHLLDGTLPKIILGLLWLGFIVGTFSSGTQYFVSAVLLMLTCVIGFLELFVFRSRYHHLWSEFFMAMYTPTLAAGCIILTYFMLCHSVSVNALFGA